MKKIGIKNLKIKKIKIINNLIFLKTIGCQNKITIYKHIVTTLTIYMYFHIIFIFTVQFLNGKMFKN